jgi:uncharacterized Zn finger protein (UPF0148 family)
MPRRTQGRHVDCAGCGNRFRTKDGGSLCPTCIRRDVAIAEKGRAEPPLDFVEPEVW